MFDSLAEYSLDNAMYFLWVKYPISVLKNDIIAENGVCPLINPCLFNSIKLLSIVLLTSIICSLSNPLIWAHSRVVCFGLTMKHKLLLFLFNSSIVTLLSLPPPIGNI